MTKDKAIHQFFSSFGMTAYPTNNVPETATFPWLTYELMVGSYDNVVQSTVHLYMHTESESIPNDKAEEICNALRSGGKMLGFDGGSVWITLASPEWYAAQDQTDRTIKHRIINVSMQYI